MKPHKHAELIKAWADGAEIEIYEISLDQWIPCFCPSWVEGCKYRIKPKPDTQYWVRVFEHSGGSMFCPHTAPATDVRPANIKLTFDGETGKLKSAEVLK
jgi:hypothetical protein